MFASAFCAEKRVKVKVEPDADAFDAAQFIIQLSGKCEIAAAQGAALIKPLKRPPVAAGFVIMPHAGRELFMLIAGMAAQMDISVRFDCVEGGVTAAELEHISEITQGLLCCGKKDGAIYLSSLLYDENPLYEKCRETSFAAGLCLGAVLARVSTLVCVPVGEEDELLRFTLEVLAGCGVALEQDPGSGETIIRSMLKTRFPEKKSEPKTKKAPESVQ